MKLKQFFIDNKDKFKKLLGFLLSVFGVFIYSISIFSCGYNVKTALDDSNKKELVNRMDRADSSNITYINLLTDEVIDSDVHAYYNANGSLVNSSALTLTNRFSVNPSVNYVYGNLVGRVAYITYFDSNGNFISSSTGSGLLTSPSTAYYCALSVFNSVLNDSYFYQGQVVYNYYLPPIQNILDDEYNEGYNSGYDIGYIDGLPKNIFYYDSSEDSPFLLVYDDVSFIRVFDYVEDLLFKNNYLDLQYLRSLYGVDYSRFRIIFTDSIYSLNNLYLSLDNSSFVDYNILVNGKSYTINSSSTLNINSSELLQAIEFDSSLLDSTRLVNSSPEFASGFNKGYNQALETGQEIGYNNGVIDTEVYYEDLIIPSIKTEFYNDGLADGRAESNAILKPFELMIKGVEPVILVLSSEIAPGITIGTISLIPLAVTMIVFLLKGLVL